MLSKPAAKSTEAPSMALLHDLVESAPDALVVVGPDGRILLVNKQTERLFGHPRTALLGQAVEMLIPQRFRAAHPGLRSGFFASPKVREMGASLELYGLDKGGTEFPVEVSLSPIENEGQRLVSAAIRDVTVRKKGELQLKLLESAPDAMVVVDVTGAIVLVNAQTERLFGYARSELMGKRVELLVPKRLASPDPVDAAILLREAKVHGMGARLELYGLRKDGTEFPVEVSLGQVETDSGVLVSSAFRDITERTKATADLKAANEELEAFAYSISHDLRAPLRSLAGFSKILLQEAGPRLDADSQHYIDMIVTSAAEMGHLIDDLLTFSRLGKQPMKRQAVDPDRMVRQVLVELRPMQDGRDVAIRITKMPRCLADPGLLHQVYTNLLSNALKYTRKRPQAEIEIGWTDAEGAYYVKDNGVGFDMKHADQLFGVFQRLHRAEDYEGTGVGLAIVQRIVVRHGGRIWAQATEEKGATFFFTIQGDQPHEH